MLFLKYMYTQVEYKRNARKAKIAIHSYGTADYFTNILQNCFLSRPTKFFKVTDFDRRPCRSIQKCLLDL